MQAQFISEGDTLQIVATEDLTSGDVLVSSGGTPFIAVRDASIGEKVAVYGEGVFDVAKANVSIAEGEAVFWNDSADPVGGDAGSGAATNVSSGAVALGFALAAAGGSDETVRVKYTAALVNSQTVGGSMTADDITGSDATLGIAGQSASNSHGGAVTIAGGAGNGTNKNGGALTLNGGDATGSGTDGAVNLGTANTSQVNAAAASVPFAIGGPVNVSVGGSTAAAGSTTSDATVLPAATAEVYPVTGADDTKGVRVHANDNVTGRRLVIANMVSNKSLKVYPPTGGTINGAATDAAFTSVSGHGVVLVCTSSGSNTWAAIG